MSKRVLKLCVFDKKKYLEFGFVLKTCALADLKSLFFSANLYVQILKLTKQKMQKKNNSEYRDLAKKYSGQMVKTATSEKLT